MSYNPTITTSTVTVQHCRFCQLLRRKISYTDHSLGLGSTPQTIVISPEGRVLKNWTGSYGEQVQAELEEYFQIRLPGLTAGSH
jgi:hypothetical protein